MTSSILISGFPADATDREMENFCRLLPEFVAAKACFKNSAKVFVRFETPEAANQAVRIVDKLPFDVCDSYTDNGSVDLLTAAIARTDLNPPQPHQAPTRNGLTCLSGWMDTLASGMAWAGAAQPRTAKRVSAAPWFEPPAKRPRTDAAQAEATCDTICVKGWGLELTEELMLKVFDRAPGFVTLQLSKSAKGGGNCFVKFSRPAQASTGISLATRAGYSAEMARTSLNLDVTPSSPVAAVPSRGKGAKGNGKVSHRGVSHQREEIDTLVFFDPPGRDLKEQDFVYMFSNVAGFLGLRYTKNHCFIKFDTPDAADVGKDYAEQQGFEVDFARSNLNLHQATTLAE